MKFHQSITIFLLSVMLVLFGAGAASAAEVIQCFESRVLIHDDGLLTVTEAITVTAEGRNVRHGIYRDFPTDYASGSLGLRRRVGFKVVSATRDGSPEPFMTKRRDNGVRVYLGSKDALVPHGTHTYELTYETDDQIGFFKDHTELYWNVTGNDWVFPIEKAVCIVELPPGGQILKHEAFTGPTGSTDKDYQARVVSPGVIRFETIKGLHAHEGLTVVVGFPNGVVHKPSFGWFGFLLDNLGAIGGVVGLVLSLLAYLWAWDRVGRDPAARTIMPLFEPPAGVSPAVARYLMKMGYDDHVFAAAMINMGVKGALHIDQTGGKYVLTRTGRNEEALTPEEQALVDRLFSGGRTSVDLKRSNHKIVSGARKAVKRVLKGAYAGSHFALNSLWVVPGAALSLLAVGATVLQASDVQGAAFISLWLCLWTTGVAALLYKAFTTRSISAGLFALPFVAGWVLGGAFLVQLSGVLTVGTLCVAGVLLAVFVHLMKAPTRLGQDTLEALEGFAMFLSVTEEERLNMLNPPEQTPELFEKYLPYALALGCEQQWSERFSRKLAQAGKEPEYTPHWYSGHSAWGWRGSSNFGGALAGAVASSASAPGSSSGFGGGGSGGSSGGGGGGGGGGGW